MPHLARRAMTPPGNARVGPRAVLLDVYDTILTCDFTVHAREIPRRAGIDPGAWHEVWSTMSDDMLCGRLTLADAYESVLRQLAPSTTRALADELAMHAFDLLVDHVHVFDDTVPFLTLLRDRGISTAIVSNCSDDTRPLLDHLGLLDLIDVVILSNEIGIGKPDHRIYRTALDRLRVNPDAAIFVDDQPADRPTSAVTSLTEVVADL